MELDDFYHMRPRELMDQSLDSELLMRPREVRSYETGEAYIKRMGIDPPICKIDYVLSRVFDEKILIITDIREGIIALAIVAGIVIAKKRTAIYRTPDGDACVDEVRARSWLKMTAEDLWRLRGWIEFHRPGKKDPRIDRYKNS